MTTSWARAARRLSARGRAPVRAVRRVGARTPLRVKLVAAVLALVTAGLTAAGLAAAASLRGYLMQRVDGQLAQAIGPFAGDRGGRPHDSDDGLGPRLPSEFYVQYVDRTGASVAVRSNPLATSDSTPALPHLTYSQARARAGEPFTVASSSDGSGWRVVAAPLADGTGSVLVAQSLSDVEHTLGRLAFLEVVIGATVVGLIAVIGTVIVRRSLRSLTEVERTAAAIAAGDLSRRMPSADPRTEVGRLSVALNGMLGHIERAFRVQQASESAARRSERQMRQFVADASHELRTPLTSIRGFAELYRQGAAAAEQPDVAHLMRRIEDQAARMGMLVDDLLLLARLDQQRPLAREPVDLLSIATDAVHDARVVAPDRLVVLRIADPDGAADALPPVVVGDESRLRQVLANLVGNGLRHATPGTPVTVSLGTGDGWAVLAVSDEGPGIAPEAAERVFERFYRADPSRHSADGGSGLGLSIVASLVAAHGGRVELDTEPGRGSTFRVVLPLITLLPLMDGPMPAAAGAHTMGHDLDRPAVRAPGAGSAG
ncbi:MAG: sensor histidine kinase [Frankiaceae bacterium]